MEKKEFLNVLAKKGFLLQEADGISFVVLGDVSEAEAAKRMQEVADLAATSAYVGSYGFKWKNKGKVQVKKPEPVYIDLDESDEGRMSFTF